MELLRTRPPKAPDLREHLVDEAGPVCGANVVGLEHHTGHAGLYGVLGQNDVVNLRGSTSGSLWMCMSYAPTN